MSLWHQGAPRGSTPPLPGSSDKPIPPATSTKLASRAIPTQALGDFILGASIHGAVRPATCSAVNSQEMTSSEKPCRMSPLSSGGMAPKPSPESHGKRQRAGEVRGRCRGSPCTSNSLPQPGGSTEMSLPQTGGTAQVKRSAGETPFPPRIPAQAGTSPPPADLRNVL